MNTVAQRGGIRSGVKPVAPLEPGGSDWRDKSKNGFDMRSLERLIRDCNQQPESWRRRSALCHAYYDGKQLTSEQEEFARAEGLKPRSTNLIGRVVNSVLGTEARQRSAVRVEADIGSMTDVTDVLNVAMKEAHRESCADMAVSSAYGCQVKGGIGWAEVSRDPDPLNYPYRVREVHRDELWWDWASKDFMLRDARWVVRSQWFDLDEICASMPDHEAILMQMANSWTGFATNLLVRDTLPNDEMTRAFDDYTRFKIRANEWMDNLRKRVRMYEVWYKVPAWAVVMKISATHTILFDETNKLHQIAMQRGLVKLEKVLTRQVRKAMFAGPYRLTDEPTTKRNFPYVPFFAFRDDANRVPYGLVDGMISPQDEYNERRLRMQWLLKAKQILVDNDALDEEHNNYEDLADEAMRPDMTLVLNAARRNAVGVQILSNLSLQKEQVDVMQDARMLIQDVPGVYGSQMGMAQGGVTANSAMQTLVDQGTISMGEMNDNYRNARGMVFGNLLDLVIEDHLETDLKVIVGDGDSTRVVVLNTFGPGDMPMNMVADARSRIGISDAPASAAARSQQQTQISEMIKSLGGMPQAVAALVPPFLESSTLDTQTRKHAVEDFRRGMGMPAGGDKNAREQASKQQAQQAQQAQQLALAKEQGAIGEINAKSAKANAEAQLAIAKANQIKNTSIAEPGIDQHISDALAEADGGGQMPPPRPPMGMQAAPVENPQQGGGPEEIPSA